MHKICLKSHNFVTALIEKDVNYGSILKLGDSMTFDFVTLHDQELLKYGKLHFKYHSQYLTTARSMGSSPH